MAQKALSAVKSIFAKLPFKAPWKITGVASSAEYQPYLRPPTDVRKHAPANPPVKPSIPQADPANVFDIRYSVRDTRKQKMVVGGTNKLQDVKTMYDVTAPDESLLANGVPTSGQPHRWSKRKNLLDYDNNGYT